MKIMVGLYEGLEVLELFTVEVKWSTRPVVRILVNTEVRGFGVQVR